MLVIIDNETNKIKQSIDKDYGVSLAESETLKEISFSLYEKYLSAYDYEVEFDEEGDIVDIAISKTREEWEAEQPDAPKPPTPEERIRALEDALLMLTLG